jgi:WhiB family redox-sensing transcriptional regulator
MSRSSGPVVEGDKIVNRYIGAARSPAGRSSASSHRPAPATGHHRVPRRSRTARRSWGVEDALGWFRQLRCRLTIPTARPGFLRAVDTRVFNRKVTPLSLFRCTGEALNTLPHAHDHRYPPPDLERTDDWATNNVHPVRPQRRVLPRRGESTREAKAVCATCPVRRPCLDYALQWDHLCGVWGGMSERERRQVRRRNRTRAL